MPRFAKYALIGFLVLWVLRNPNAAAGSFSGVLDALFTFMDESTKPKA